MMQTDKAHVLKMLDAIDAGDYHCSSKIVFTRAGDDSITIELLAQLARRGLNAPLLAEGTVAVDKVTGREVLIVKHGPVWVTVKFDDEAQADRLPDELVQR